MPSTLREWVLTWGATPGEAARSLPGDDLLDPADIVATRAVTVHAPPSAHLALARPDGTPPGRW